MGQLIKVLVVLVIGLATLAETKSTGKPVISKAASSKAPPSKAALSKAAPSKGPTAKLPVGAKKVNVTNKPVVKVTKNPTVIGKIVGAKNNTAVKKATVKPVVNQATTAKPKPTNGPTVKPKVFTAKPMHGTIGKHIKATTGKPMGGTTGQPKPIITIKPINGTTGKPNKGTTGKPLITPGKKGATKAAPATTGAPTNAAQAPSKSSSFPIWSIVVIVIGAILIILIILNLVLCRYKKGVFHKINCCGGGPDQSDYQPVLGESEKGVKEEAEEAVSYGALQEGKEE